MVANVFISFLPLEANKDKYFSELASYDRQDKNCEYEQTCNQNRFMLSQPA